MIVYYLRALYMVNWKNIGIAVGVLALVGIGITAIVLAFTPSPEEESPPPSLSPEERKKLMEERDDLQMQLDNLEFATPEVIQRLQTRIQELDELLSE